MPPGLLDGCPSPIPFCGLEKLRFSRESTRIGLQGGPEVKGNLLPRGLSSMMVCLQEYVLHALSLSLSVVPALPNSSVGFRRYVKKNAH